MSYEIYETEEFKRLFEKEIPINLQDYFKKKINKLRINPFGMGKPLGTKSIRELKIKGFRLYYLVYENNLFVLLASVSNKKNQKEIIQKLKENKELIKEFVKKPDLD